MRNNLIKNLIVFTSVQIRWLGRLGVFRSCTFQIKDWLLTSTWEGTSKPLELPACQERLCIPGVLTMSYSLCQQYDFCWTLAFVCLGVSGPCYIGLTSRRLELEKLKSVMWFPHAGIRSTLTDPPGPRAQVSFSGWQYAHELSHHCWQNYMQSIQLRWEGNGCTWFLLRSALSTF